MDPISGLSIATATVQFVDFACKLVSRAHHIKTSAGEVPGYKDIATSTKNIVQLSATLNDSIEQQSIGDLVTTNDAEILKIANECGLIGKQLLIVLDKKSSKNPGKWDSFRLALISFWDADEVDALEQRLLRYRQDLIPLLLISLREQFEGQKKSAAAANQKNKSVGQEFLRHIRDDRNWKSDLLQEIRNRHAADQSMLPQDSLLNFDGSKRSQNFVAALTARLRFAGMEDRKEHIAEAYKRTFDWLFEDRQVHCAPWSSFVDWLAGASDLYWITGKAGSGKSTLMKYIFHHPLTGKSLEKWVDGKGLITAAFFFWNSGTRLEMSQEGLFRSLLSQILKQRPHLAPVLFPAAWEEHMLFGQNPQVMEFSELRRAFRALKYISAETDRVCLFVDGLDEFDGDLEDLVSILRDVVQPTHIKVCTSSRPWPVFEEAFNTTPGLRLEELTAQDIKLFVHESFAAHSGFLEMQKYDKPHADALLQTIGEKASGVFLWVHLVVKSLLAGLSSGDSLASLQGRLNACPEKLEDLFQGILDSIAKDATLFNHASRLFQVHRATRGKMPLVTLYFTDEASLEQALVATYKPMSVDETLYRARLMAKRLNSRCKGLLEVGEHVKSNEFENTSNYSDHNYDSDEYDDDPSDGTPDVDGIDMTELSVKARTEASITLSSTVYYLHRTVREWIEQPKIWDDLEQSTRTTFHPYLALSTGLLTQIAASHAGTEAMTLWFRVLACIKYAREDKIARDGILVRLHEVMCQLHRAQRFDKSTIQPAEAFLYLMIVMGFSSVLGAGIKSPHSKLSIRPRSDRPCLLDRVIDFSNFEWLMNDIALMGVPRKDSDIESEVRNVIRSLKNEMLAEPSLECIQTLLQAGSDPNRKTSTGKSAWERLLECLPTLYLERSNVPRGNLNHESTMPPRLPIWHPEYSNVPRGSLSYESAMYSHISYLSHRALYDPGHRQYPQTPFSSYGLSSSIAERLSAERNMQPVDILDAPVEVCSLEWRFQTWVQVVTAFLNHGAEWTKEIDNLLHEKVLRIAEAKEKMSEECSQLSTALKRARASSKQSRAGHKKSGRKGMFR